MVRKKRAFLVKLQLIPAFIFVGLASWLEK
jgi:hypothetical protein